MTRTNDIPSACPATTILKIMKAGADRLGYKECSTSRMAINSSCATTATPASRPGFCFQGCAGAKMVDALHRNQRRGDRTPGGAAELQYRRDQP